MLHNILQYGLLGLGLASGVGGYLSKVRRSALWAASISALSAAAAAHYDSFWVMVSFTLLSIWGLVAALKTLDIGWRARFGLVTISFLLTVMSIWPTVWSMSHGKVWCPAYIRDNVSFRMVAGLDLSGGLRLVYTVDVEEAIRDKRDRYFDEMRQMLTTSFGFHSGDKPPTREELSKLTDKVEMIKPRGDAATIILKFKDPSDASKIDERFTKRFQHEVSTIRAGGDFTFKIKTEIETNIRESAVSQAKDTINRRVDELGLKEATVIVRDEDIIIEVPGENEKSFQEIREIISKTARLEFKMLDDDTDFFAPIAKKFAKDSDLPKGIGFGQENAPVGPNKTNPTHYARVVKQPDEDMKKSLERLKSFLDQFPPPTDREVGYQILHDTDPNTEKTTEVGWRTYFLMSRADITGDQIRDAQAQPDQQTGGGMGGWHVALTFTDSGAERFEEVTGANIKRRFAIILDNKVESAPVIQTRIAGGHAQITMGASDPQSQLEDSRKLELVLRSGALPAPITPSNEQRIGPSLGRDAIEHGIRAGLIGGVLVLLFMVIYYHKAGLIADVAVMFNLMVQMAVLSSFGASMTLPGIAGLALTIGMSVDANVLINERIREELREGKSPRAAVEAGYEKAFNAIIDGHVTTLLSGIILAQYGTGPIKGFAVTLIVGMLSSLFTTVFATRVIFEYWVRGIRTTKLSLG
jgi:preprotein translocase subunit SecD